MPENRIARFYYEAQPINIRFDDQGDPLWLASEVCQALNLTEVGRAVARLDSDEKVLLLEQTLGGPQKMSFVNEAGLYTLILRSRKSSTKKFRRWITHVVLPSIRKTGRYETPTAISKAPTADSLASMSVETLDLQAGKANALARGYQRLAKAKRIVGLEVDALVILVADSLDPPVDDSSVPTVRGWKKGEVFKRVAKILDDPKNKEASSRKIAKLAGVSHTAVNAMRNERRGDNGQK